MTFGTRTFAFVTLSVALLLSACGSDGSDAAKTAFQQQGQVASLPPGHPPIESTPMEGTSTDVPTSAAGVTWTVPAGWQPKGGSAMRVATYTIHTNREGNAECAVYYFGTGQGGDVQANIDRWVNQFQQPDGSPSKDHAKTNHSQKSGWAVTTVEVSGTYTGGMGPMAGNKEPQQGFRMMGAIVEGPQGPVFFKLTGPEQVVVSSAADFQSLIDSLRPAG